MAATALVGRARQLTVLRDALSRAVAGEGGVLVVRGDPGVGKSTLVATALDTVDVTRFLGHAVPGGSRPGRAVSEIAVAALAAGARLDDPGVALFRRPMEPLIGTTPAGPGVVENPAAFGPLGAAVGEGCSGSWNSRRTEIGPRRRDQHRVHGIPDQGVPELHLIRLRAGPDQAGRSRCSRTCTGPTPTPGASWSPSGTSPGRRGCCGVARRRPGSAPARPRPGGPSPAPSGPASRRRTGITPSQTNRSPNEIAAAIIQK